MLWDYKYFINQGDINTRFKDPNDNNIRFKDTFTGLSGGASV